MNRYKKIIASVTAICLMAGCAAGKAAGKSTEGSPTLPPQETPASQVPSTQSTSNSQASSGLGYLFEAKDIESIQLTGRDILDGKEANMSVKISDAINMDFHISRDSPNGTQLYAIYNSTAYNLAANYISPDVFDNDEAIPEYSYQLACYDFDNDGTKEIVVAAGNNDDTLSVFIFYVDVEAPFVCYPENYILGYKNSYVNKSNEICVPSPNGVKVYKYNVRAEDAEYAKLSGPIKISVNFAAEDQMKLYVGANKYVKDEGAPTLLILPTEKLGNVSICLIEYDTNTDRHYVTKDLYNISELTPEKPLLVQAFLPDFPALAVSYTDEFGTAQLWGIAESLKDGTVYLFEMGTAKG
ncbi:MAG TPA: hypothetical protein VN626_11460 [Clostridia bacterium]|nr:hypothetical protein [Clostridia bacterium]